MGSAIRQQQAVTVIPAGGKPKARPGLKLCHAGSVPIA